MRIYLFLQSEIGGANQTVECFFFKLSALQRAVRRIAFGGKWEEVTDHGTDAIKFWTTSALWMSIVPVEVEFLDWSLCRWIHQHCHWQNLNEDRQSKVKGSILKHGRAWFHRKWDDSRGHGKQVMFSWSFGWKGRISAEMDLFDGDSYRDISFNVAFLFFWFFLTLENWLPKKYGYPRHSWAHGTGFYYSEDSFRVEFHHAGDDCYDCQGYKGWYRHWFVSDLIWGRATYSENVLSESDHVVEMPEGSYPVKVRLVESIWNRPRKPWLEKLKRAHIDIERGIPTPGKGENSWDCGQDATYGLTTPAASVEEALDHLRASIERDRQRYGGKNWVPEKVAV